MQQQKEHTGRFNRELFFAIELKWAKLLLLDLTLKNQKSGDTGSFTAPYDGTYAFHVHVLRCQNSGALFVHLMKNQDMVSSATNQDVRFETTSCTAILGKCLNIRQFMMSKILILSKIRDLVFDTKKRTESWWLYLGSSAPGFSVWSFAQSLLDVLWFPTRSRQWEMNWPDKTYLGMGFFKQLTGQNLRHLRKA